MDFPYLAQKLGYVFCDTRVSKYHFAAIGYQHDKRRSWLPELFMDLKMWIWEEWKRNPESGLIGNNLSFIVPCTYAYHPDVLTQVRILPNEFVEFVSYGRLPLTGCAVKTV